MLNKCILSGRFILVDVSVVLQPILVTVGARLGKSS